MDIRSMRKIPDRIRLAPQVDRYFELLWVHLDPGRAKLRPESSDRSGPGGSLFLDVTYVWLAGSDQTGARAWTKFIWSPVNGQRGAF
jgi:hypothetical protein